MTDAAAACRPGRPRSDATRRAILQAAFELLREGGLAQFTIEAVAARAGAGKTTIYRWWPSKGALAMEALLNAVEDIAPFRQTASAVADLRAHMQALAAAFAGPFGCVLRSIIAAGQSDPCTLETYRATLLEPRLNGVRAILRRGIEGGELRSDLDPEAAIDALFGPFYARLLIARSPLDEPGWVDRLCDTVLCGIAGPALRESRDPPAGRAPATAPPGRAPAAP